MGWYVRSTRNGVRETLGDLEPVCNEAVQSRGRGPGIIHTSGEGNKYCTTMSQNIVPFALNTYMKTVLIRRDIKNRRTS